MEYLTLHDVPHRHYDSLHSRRMASPESHRRSPEKALPSLAAVCEALPMPLLPPLDPPPAPYTYRCSLHHDSFSDPVSTQFNSNPNTTTSTSTPRASDAFLLPRPINPQSPNHHPSLYIHPHPPPHPPDHHSAEDPAAMKRRSTNAMRIDSLCEPLNDTETATQNHYDRTSPPFQPGEQRPSQNSLPSFSQLIQKVREPSPPRTPSRRNGSSDSSPISKPQFDDVAWGEGKRRRVDTLMDMHHRPSSASEHGAYDTRRSSVIDPALSSYGSPRISHQPVMHPTAPSHHHRPSLPYPSAPPTHGHGHVRHQSSPIPHSHAGYHQQPAPGHPAMVAAPGYPPAPGHHAAGPYEHRGSYYQEGHSYERPSHDPYYGQQPYAAAPHPAYPNGYHPQAPQYNYTFQSQLTMDQNSFNRKRRGNLPKEATNILKAWFSANRESPYPTEEQKIALCQQTALSMNQVSNWFINARRRAPQKEQREAREANDE